MADDEKVVAFRDPEGNVYVLPWYLVERGRVPDEQRTAVEDAMDGDVEGFAMRYFDGKLLSAADLTQDQQYHRGTAHLSAFDLSAHLARVSWSAEASGTWPP